MDAKIRCLIYVYKMYDQVNVSWLSMSWTLGHRYIQFRDLGLDMV